MVLGAIDVRGIEIWFNSLGNTMSSFVILSHSEKKLVEGQLWEEVT